MSTSAGSMSGGELKAAQRVVWGMGDYHRVATETIPHFGSELVSACGIGPGQRVLDVAAGTGNVAIPAAEAGAEVVASDLTPDLLEIGRREAARRGVELQWVEADVEALPFADAEFDVVTSAAGAMFAPDHGQTARELLRVCRPGGTIGMINYTPEGFAGQMFRTLERYVPVRPDAPAPMRWGDPEYVRELFGDGVDSLTLTHGQTLLRFPSARALCDFYRSNFGPAIVAFAAAEHGPDGTQALERDFESLAERTVRPDGEGGGTWPLEYLLVVARRSSS